MTDHPITPPPELVAQWRKLPENTSQLRMMSTVTLTTEKLQAIATQAARWGADQELQACCNWLPRLPPWSGEDLRRDRRSKQPTPKELALLELADVYGRDMIDDSSYDTIRVALETLPE